MHPRYRNYWGNIFLKRTDPFFMHHTFNPAHKTRLWLTNPKNRIPFALARPFVFQNVTNTLFLILSSHRRTKIQRQVKNLNWYSMRPTRRRWNAFFNSHTVSDAWNKIHVLGTCALWYRCLETPWLASRDLCAGCKICN